MPQRTNLLQDIDLKALQQFTLKRSQDNGGFGATPLLPHTISDTYCAVEILAAIRKKLAEPAYSDILADRATRDYLARFAAGSGAVSARIHFQLSALLHRFAMTPEMLPPIARRQEGFRNYEELFYLVQAEEDIASARAAAPDFLTMPDKNVKECYFFLRLEEFDAGRGRRNHQTEHTALHQWLARSQGWDGGFGFFPGTTSFLENCDYALRALALIGDRPADSAKAARFIRLCQTGAGGFARSPAAAPFLESSLNALHALGALQQINQQGRTR